MKSLNKYIIVAVLVVVGGWAAQAQASHTWGAYHWARTSNPFTLKLVDNVTPNWDSSLVKASADWSISSVLDTIVVPGVATSKNCKPSAGRVEICNSRYGNNGWLGIASIWASGSHITQGTVKMNDTYFNTSTYNKPEWRQFVMCQEIGHTFGLDHQDENFGNANLDTCMDYTNNPLSNQTPNTHDYEMLETLYAHLDSTNTVSQATNSLNRQEVDHNDRSSWGKSIRTSADRKKSLYVKETKDGNIFTFVVWAE